MEENGLDALLIFSGPNFFYFSGVPCGRSGSRPFILLLPREAEAVVLVHQARLLETRLYSSIANILTYTGLSVLPVEQMLGLLSKLHLERGVLGTETGQEMVMDIPLNDFFELQMVTPKIQYIDASPLLWRMRTIKSPAEVARIAQACAITSQAYDLTFQNIRPGSSEIEVEKMMLRYQIELGGSNPWLLTTSGVGNYEMISKAASPRTIEPGDMVWMDGGCAVEGYWSDFSRAGVVGGATSEQADTQETINNITMDAVRMVRPGVPVSEIAQSCDEALARLRLPVTASLSGLASRVGHGLGLNITELPSLNVHDRSILEEGMVVTIEPGFATPFGTFHVEQNVWVTASEPVILSQADWRLRSIQA